jgi:hypothetical protein
MTMARIQATFDAEKKRAGALKWWLVKLDGKTEVKLTCGNGHPALLDHEVDDNGVVTPSVDCPVEGCGFHEHVTLGGWQEHGAAATAVDPLKELEDLGDAMDENGPEGGGSIRA